MDEQRELQQRKRNYQNNNKRKRNKTKGILALKNTMTELQNSVESFNSRLN